MKKLNRPYHTRILGMIFSLMLISMFASAQGWEVIEEDNFEVPSEIISPSRGGYLSVGTTVLPGTGPVLLLDRVDIEGNRVFIKQYDVIAPVAGSANSLTVNEFSVIDRFLITSPQIGYLKVLNNGVVDWQKDVTDLDLPPENHVVWSSITNNNQAYIVSEGSNNSIANTSLVKINSDGDPLWEFTTNQTYEIKPISNITTNDGGCAIICDYIEGGVAGLVIIRINSDGTGSWLQKYPSLSANGRTLVQDSTGDILFVDRSTGNNRIYRVNDNSGIGEPWKTISQDILFNAAKLLVDSNEDFVLSGHRIEDDLSKPTLMKFDPSGIEIWTRLHEVQDGATIISTSLDKENNVVSNGQYFIDQPIIYATPYRLSVDTNGEIYDNFITGNVYSDDNYNCSFDNNDIPLSNWLIMAEGAVDFYGVTDEQGNYSIPVPIGSYTVSVSSPSIFYDPCVPSYSVEATDNPTSFVLDFGMQPEEACPYLQVEVSVPFLRFCYEQVYYVDYCNYGTEAADDVSVEVMLDDLLGFVSASPIAPIVQANNKYLFNIPGTLGVGECGQFTITTQLTCEEDFVGSTACVDATISPICIEQLDPSPYLVVEGSCLEDSDSIQFNITNVGNSPLLNPKTFIVIEDHIVLSVGQITENIQPQEMVIRTFPATDGGTMNFLIEQEVPIATNQIIDPFATATVEGCVGYPSAPYTFSNFFDQDAELWYSEECNEIISSFDPNDKQVIPNGVDEEHHYILPNTSMEYKVRFQNTGTDTAFLVVIRDTISPLLDLTTFVPGSSSHPYRYEILNDGYLKFTFENILLPDSTTNEPASHGFIKYTIRQQPDVPLGSVIENCAAIYFDFNSPVLTNCTWNTVQLFDNWVVPIIELPIDEISSVNVFPNPFDEYVNFKIESERTELLYEEKTFFLYNPNGKLIRTESFDQSNYQFQRNDLPKGMYFYKIHHKGIAFNSGKLIIQ